MRIRTLLLGAVTLATAWGTTISTGTVAIWNVDSNPVVIESPIALPQWIPNFGDGQWVGTAASDGDHGVGKAPGTYIFTLNIGAYIGLGGTFNLQYAADNNVIWTISNGGTLSGADSCLTGDCFQATNGAPRSLSGTFTSTSVLFATVTNLTTVNTPMGLLVVGDASGIPEPSTYAMFGLGAAALVVARLRRRK